MAVAGKHLLVIDCTYWVEYGKTGFRTRLPWIVSGTNPSSKQDHLAESGWVPVYYTVGESHGGRCVEAEDTVYVLVEEGIGVEVETVLGH